MSKRKMNSQLGLGLGVEYEHLSPIEVAQLSRSGAAIGYEPFRWGEKAERLLDLPPVAHATAIAVKFDRWSETDVKFVYSDSQNVGSTSSIRSKYLSAKMWIPWESLSYTDRNYALSLIWVPEEPMAPLEALASFG